MTQTPARPGERIAKLLARAGIASRREVERMIGEGRVRIGGELVTTPATVLPNLAGVTVDGKPVRAAEVTRLFLFHKPSGLITAERDPNSKPTIYTALRNALPPGTPRVMPVGRLDLNTEGLLLLTNDGELKRAMELPASGVPRTYRARTFGDVTQAQLETLIEGIEIGDIRYGAIDANMERRTGRNQWIELTLAEGKNREVRRVLEFLGLEVSRLLRTAYGPFLLADLPRGSAWEVPQVVVERFRKALQKGDHALAPIFAPPIEAQARPAERAAPSEAERPAGRSSGRAAERRPAPAEPRGARTTGPARRDERGPERAGAASGARTGGRSGSRSGEGAGERPAERAPARWGDRSAERRAAVAAGRGRRSGAATPADAAEAGPARAPQGRRARGNPGGTGPRGEDRETLYTRRSEAASSPAGGGREGGPRKDGGGRRPAPGGKPGAGGSAGPGGRPGPGGSSARPGAKPKGRRP